MWSRPGFRGPSFFWGERFELRNIFAGSLLDIAQAAQDAETRGSLWSCGCRLFYGARFGGSVGFDSSRFGDRKKTEA